MRSAPRTAIPTNAPTRVLARKAIALRDAGRFDEAIRTGLKAVAADGRNIVALHNLARLLRDVGRPAEGEMFERRALAVQPDNPTLRFGLAVSLLTQGRYREAWPYYEARTQLPEIGSGFPQGVHFPRWMGEPIAGRRIAIFPEQGFGDQIQFARLVPWLRDRCAGIVLLAPPGLTALFAQAFPDVTVVAAVGEACFPRCDYWTTLSDLPARAALAPEDIPAGDYLARARVTGPVRRIGLVTKGNADYLHDAHRTLPAATAERLRARLPGEVVELDPAITGARTFAETARIMEDLDTIVSVDTAVGHLAGAMGKPCLLLVAGFAADWRWGVQGEETRWYPRHRLFRAETNGDWDGAVARACDTLSEVAAA